MKRLLIRAVWILGFSAVKASSAAAVAQEQATQAQSKRAAGLRSPHSGRCIESRTRWVTAVHYAGKRKAT